LAWRRRALIAFGVLAATLLWSGPLASDQIDDALSLVAQERYPEARAALEALLEREPEAPRVRVLHGILLAREGNFIDAIAIFEGLRDERPDMFEAYNNLAVLYAGLGRLDVARRALIAAVELKSDAVLYANLGDVYMRLAQRAYARARELSFEDAAATERGGDADAAAVYPVTPGESFVAAATEDGEQEPVAAPQEAEGAGESPPASADPAGAAAADPVGAAAADPVGAASADPAVAAAADPVVAASADLAVAASADPVVAASADLAVAASADPVGTAAADPVVAASADLAVAASADPVGAVCVRAGTFKDILTATEVAKWVQTHGARVLAIRHEQHETFSNNRVYLPAASSRAAAAATVGELRGRGVSDVAVILKGPLTNAVSLGVFRKESNMRRRVAELETLGYSVSTVANTRVEDEFAIEARADGDGAAFDDAWTAAFPGQPIRSIDCDDRR
jgi:tetratricopeptide (TPR) repeat protein